MLNNRFAYFQDLIIELTKKELKVRYKHLSFGYLWSVANPLMFTLIYYFVFKIILKVKMPNYTLFLVAGLFPWQWITNSIGVAPTTFWNNSQLIKKTLFPRFLIPFVVVTQDLIHFLITIPIIAILTVIFGAQPSWNWLIWVPILSIIQFILTYSLNLVIASGTLFFRDIERFVSILLMIVFYMTPILYSESMIPQEYHHLIPYNPFATLMICWRSVFMENTIDLKYLGIAAAWSLFFFVFAHLVYKKLVWKFAELL